MADESGLTRQEAQALKSADAPARIEAIGRIAKWRADFRDSTRAGGVFAFRLRPDGTTGMPFASRNLADVCGLQPADVCEDAAEVLARIHAEDAARIDGAMADSARTLAPFRQEFRVCHPEKGDVWVEVISIPEREVDDSVLWRGFFRDVGDRRTAEKALQENQEWLRLALQSAQAGVWAWDIRTDALSWSPENYELHGIDPARTRLAYADWENCLHPADVAPTTRAVHDAIERRLTEYRTSFRIEHPRLGLRWMLAIGRVEYGADGTPLRMSGINIDITDRKRDEAERIAQLERQRDILVREVHHRIKNHLQGVIGLLRNRTGQHPEAAAVLEEAIGQIRNIAHVYGLQSRRQDARVLLDQLVEAAAQNAASPVAVECRLPPAGRVPALATGEEVSVALLIGELMTNAFKHVAGPARPIRLEIDVDGDRARLRVRNGPATLPIGFDFPAGRGLGTGLELVRSLLPPDGAQLDFRQDDDEVVAELILTAPVICVGD